MPEGLSCPPLWTWCLPSLPACCTLLLGAGEPGNSGQVGSSDPRTIQGPDGWFYVLSLQRKQWSNYNAGAAAGTLEEECWDGPAQAGRPNSSAKVAGPLCSPPPQAARPGRVESSRASEAPARGANHLCHTVTIILHKIIIKNPNFSASNPASGLLAFFSAASAGRDQGLITAAWRPARSQSSAN